MTAFDGSVQCGTWQMGALHGTVRSKVRFQPMQWQWYRAGVLITSTHILELAFMVAVLVALVAVA